MHAMAGNMSFTAVYGLHQNCIDNKVDSHDDLVDTRNKPTNNGWII